MPSSPSPILSSPCTQRSTAHERRALQQGPVGAARLPMRALPCTRIRTRTLITAPSPCAGWLKRAHTSTLGRRSWQRSMRSRWGQPRPLATSTSKVAPLVRADCQFGMILRTKGGVSVTLSNVEPCFVDCKAPSTHAPWHCIHGPRLSLWLQQPVLHDSARGCELGQPHSGCQFNWCHTGFRRH
jgi:hypothetical protein